MANKRTPQTVQKFTPESSPKGRKVPQAKVVLPLSERENILPTLEKLLGDAQKAYPSIKFGRGTLTLY